MPIDLQYLVWLQDLRAATGGIFDEIFNALSKVSVEIMPFLPFLVFWGLSRKWGYRFMLTHMCGELLNGIIKLTVCAYRPWIRSDQIVPAGTPRRRRPVIPSPAGIPRARRRHTALLPPRHGKRKDGWRSCAWC